MKALSSLRLAVAAMAALVLWTAWGVQMAFSPSLAPLLRALAEGHLLVHPSQWGQAPALGMFWVLGLLALSGLLALNLLCCSLSKLVRYWSWRNALLLALHLAVLLVMLAHGATLVVGYQRQHQRLLPGRSLTLPDGAALSLRQAHLEPQPMADCLRQAAQKQTRRRPRFPRGPGWAEVALSRDGLELGQGRVAFMQPWEADGLRINLVGYFCRPGPQPVVGAVVNVSRRPLAKPFFAAYGAAMACWLLLLILDLRRKRGGPALD